MMTTKERIQLAYDMGGQPYSVGGMIAALEKGEEIGRNALIKSLLERCVIFDKLGRPIRTRGELLKTLEE